MIQPGYRTAQNTMIEWSYHSGTAYPDPFNDVTVDMLITAPDGSQVTVPAFWAGEQTWRVRYAGGQTGLHRFTTRCSDAANGALHGQEGTLEVLPYTGHNPLLQHGPLRVATDRRYLEHTDGTPFFWLADTWWMGLCRRLRWPEDFTTLMADRVAKGFSVIQIVAGLYPDMPAFDPRGANEAGFPWTEDYSRINPAYFDAADLRMGRLVDSGLVPCLVACWGYFIGWMGVPRMKQHWRYLIARYGAYPMVWCLAGETAMPYYLSADKAADAARQRREWTEVAAYIREIDPFKRPLTAHPTEWGRQQLDDPTLLDIDMLQTGHGDRDSLGPTVQRVTAAVAAEPRLPVIDGEVCYEGILEASRQEVQRLMFWVCLLSGAAGHTYGANGIWQVNTRQTPYGPSPHGFSWGDTSWDEAYQLPGSRQLGLGKRLLERYRWWRFDSHAEWVTSDESSAGGGAETEARSARVDLYRPYAAGIACEVRVVYFPWMGSGRWFGAHNLAIADLEPDVTYRAYFYSPVDGRDYDLGPVQRGDDGRWPIPLPSLMHDWVLVLESVA